MRKITVRELHMRTGQVVREAATAGYVVTERGRPVARLLPLEERPAGKPLPDREACFRTLPVIRRDSTVLIREERDRR